MKPQEAAPARGVQVVVGEPPMGCLSVPQRRSVLPACALPFRLAAALVLAAALACEDKPADLTPQPLARTGAGLEDSGSSRPLPLPDAGPASQLDELTGAELAALQSRITEQLGADVSRLAARKGGETAGPLQFTLRYSARGALEQATLDLPMPAFQKYIDAVAELLKQVAGPARSKPYLARVKVEASYAYTIRTPARGHFRSIQIIRPTAPDAGPAPGRPRPKER